MWQVILEIGGEETNLKTHTPHITVKDVPDDNILINCQTPKRENRRDIVQVIPCRTYITSYMEINVLIPH